MKIKFRLAYFLFPIVSVITIDNFAQVNGDFRTKNMSGNWSDFNAWYIYNAGWTPATAGQIPSASSNVFIQSGQTISVDNSLAVCNNVNIENSGALIAFSNASAALNVKGNFITNNKANCFGSWSSGAKIIFSGTANQTLPDNLGTFSVLDDIEINKSSGTLTSGNSIKFNKFILTAGNFVAGKDADIRGNSASATININGGTWTQNNGKTTIYNAAIGNTSPVGTITINGGTMELATSTGTGGLQLSVVNVTNSGIFILDNFSGLINISTSINVDATSVFNTALITTPFSPVTTFAGLVSYNNTGAQTITAATYPYLKLTGSGIKTLGSGITSIPANGTLEISGTTSSATLALGGNTFSVSSSGTNLLYTSAASQTATANEWDANFQNITINNLAGVSMGGLSRTIKGSLNLTNGTLNIGTSGALTLDGASLNTTNGYLNGVSTSDLTITGTTGGNVTLPFSSDISLHNLTVTGTRKLILNGINNISLYGLFTIGSTATFDNGGESQIIDGGSGVITISGKFINRDKDNFTGTKGAIPGISPTLNAGCTIEYGLGGDQNITPRNDYQNITFSGSGTKTPSNTFTPLNTLYITGNAIVDASNHNIGDGITLTNFTMDGGRLILGTTGTQPMMAGTYNLSGGIVQFDGANNQTIRSQSYQNIEVTGAGVGNSNGNITLNSNGTFTVKNNGIFKINDNNITGAGNTQTITVENGATFRCGNNQGFNGFKATLTNNSSIDSAISNINLNSGSTVEYMRAGDQPITNANGLIYSNLNLAGSGNKIAPSGTLIIQGNLASSGSNVFNSNGGIVLLNGTNQNFAGLTYNNLILTNGTKTTSGSSAILDSIKINDGTTLSISDGDIMTLHSDATKTARVGQFVSGIINYNSTGKFVIERYIPAKKAWRFLSVPINSLQTIKNAWQEGASNYSQDPKPNYGTQITSDNSNWSVLGFDTLSFAPSIKTYNSTSDTYTGITSTNISFDPSKGGYMTFIRGDRTATSINSPVTSTTLRTSGQLFTGTQGNIALITGQFIPVNNPYPSAIDLRNLSQSSSIFYYVWDPNRGGANGFGGFSTLYWDGATDYDVLPANTGSYGATNNYIDNGQAFFVSGTGTIQLSENAKTSATFSISPFIPVSARVKLRSNLYSVNADGASFLADGVLTDFADNYSNSVDEMDAKKMMNFSENLSLKREGFNLAIERKHTLITNDTIFFNLTGVKKQPYRFEFIPSQLSQPGVQAFLEDDYLKTKTRLNLNDTNRINFNVDINPASSFPGRFRIIFNVAEALLPVTFTNVNAYTKNETIAVEWETKNESGIKNYSVQKSNDGVAFTGAFIIASRNNNAGAFYKWIDAQPAPGLNYYRIKSIGFNEKIQYSKIVQASLNDGKKGILVYPNPSNDGIIHLQFNNQPDGKYFLQLLNSSGQILLSKEIDLKTSGAISKKILINKYLSRGIYYIEIIKPNGNKVNLPVVY